MLAYYTTLARRVVKKLPPVRTEPLDKWHKRYANVWDLTDSFIVTSLDTCTSMISGVTIFGVLGNLAYQLGFSEVRDIIGTGGSSIAFVSYPDAIAKSPIFPQLFAGLFFIMMVVLGVGCSMAYLSTITTIMMDHFPHVSTLVIAAATCVAFWAIGLVYVTPGGQYILELVDFYGGAFLGLLNATCEIIGIIWIYGLENLALDIEFMSRRKISVIWRACFAIFTPLILLFACGYTLVTSDQLKYGETYVYPASAYIAGAALQYFGIALYPLSMIILFFRNRPELKFRDNIRALISQEENYGPMDDQTYEDWKSYRSDRREKQLEQAKTRKGHWFLSVINGYKYNTQPRQIES